MNKVLKIFLFLFLTFTVIVAGILCAFFIITSGASLDKEKLISTQKTIVILDDNGDFITEVSNNHQISTFNEIPNHVKNAFISIEDKRFYSHNGIDRKALLRATFKNIKSLSFKEGASTISQQLIKNTHLTNEKTLKRKLIEIKLAKQLEKHYSKDQILEMYLNTIYFGNNCYGISSASKFYFDKNTTELSLAEGALLAGIIKAPSHYSPLINESKCLDRRNLVLEQMLEQNLISYNEYNSAIKTPISINKNINENQYNFNSLIIRELNDYLDKYAYINNKIIVYTTINQTYQNNLINAINNDESDTEKASIIIEKDGRIKAYFSTISEQKRQMGSVIKPLLVYAPAIEENVVDSCSLILDEKTDFNGYSPSNYNDIYYGYVSVKNSLVKSLNVCSAKILQSLGVENVEKYAKKLNIPFSNNDKNLALALGSTEDGATFNQIVSAYSVFLNEGNYVKPYCIEKITDEYDNTIYKNIQIKTKVFSDDTSHIISDMLYTTVKEGTCKKLSYLPFEVCGKSGTVGNKNGNTDAYSISYNENYIVGSYVGAKENILMPNSITGGTNPTIINYQVWNCFSNMNCGPYKKSENVVSLDIDKISYNDEKIIELADDNAPKRYVSTEIFRKNSSIKNKSNRFSSPKVEKPILSVENNGICIQLCLKEYYDIKIFKEINGKRSLVCDTKYSKNSNKFIDSNLEPNSTCSYYAIPYFTNENKEYLGEEIFLGQIKTPSIKIDDDWWQDNLD